MEKREEGNRSTEPKASAWEGVFFQPGLTGQLTHLEISDEPQERGREEVTWNSKKFFSRYFLFLVTPWACRLLEPGIELVPPCSLNHWTARKVPGTQIFGPYKGRVISGTVLRRPWGPKEVPAPQAGAKTWSLGNWETQLADPSPGRITDLKGFPAVTCVPVSFGTQSSTLSNPRQGQAPWRPS